MNTCTLCGETYIEMNEAQHESEVKREFRITINSLVFRLCGRGPFRINWISNERIDMADLCNDF